MLDLVDATLQLQGMQTRRLFEGKQAVLWLMSAELLQPRTFDSPPNRSHRQLQYRSVMVVESGVRLRTRDHKKEPADAHLLKKGVCQIFMRALRLDAW